MPTSCSPAYAQYSTDLFRQLVHKLDQLTKQLLGCTSALPRQLVIHLHFDGLAAPQGSAYDGALELRLAPFEKIHFSLGARILGGGADNDKLKTFAQFNSYTASLIFNF